MSVTIKDVAREAGVSVATVSRVLNGSCNVSDDSAKKVNEAIEKLNYLPNFLGRNLRKRETKVILCITPTSEHSLYSKIIMGMNSYASKVGYEIISAVSTGNTSQEVGQLKMLFNKTVDGAVLLGTSFSAQELNKLAKNYDIALCCEGVVGADVLTVAVDDEQAAYDAVMGLIKQGHKRIAFVGADLPAISAVARENGYKKALEDAGISCDEKLIFKKTYDYECGEQALEQFWSCEDKPTAVFTISDLLAISVIHSAVGKGISIPNELSVMGFDNISMCEMMLPTVSTVEQPCEKLGEVVIAKLIENIHSNDKDNGYYTVGHKLIFRDSTKV